MPPKAANAIDAYVAGRLRTHRKQLGLSQAEIAKKLGVTFQQIQKYEAGINRVGAGRLFQFASLFGLPLQEFFPHISTAPDADKRIARTEEVQTFAAGAEGSRLCEAFMRVSDSKKRRALIALIEGMDDTE